MNPSQRKSKNQRRSSGKRNRASKQGNRSAFDPPQSLAVVYRRPRNFLPPEFVNTLRTTQTGYIPSGTVLSTAGFWATVAVGDIFEPFNTSQPLTTAVASHGFALSYTASSSTTQNGAGYTEMTRLYSSYRVQAFRYRMIWQPSAAADVFTVSLSATGFPSIQTGNLPVGALGGLNLERRYQFNLYEPTRAIELRANCWDVLGLSKAQYITLPTALVGATPVGTALAELAINGYLLSAGTLAGNVAVTIELEQDVEWSSLLITNLEN